ncbi:MAG TPA: sn-glycerol-3-phosphate import ATP-binding protein UgpC [Gammaproteobacteria bacterium]|nr:sn-glycerol-3-phosphate import ATP-binding protein UgpC [Gammaproteobacteria bacterium]
MAQMQILNVVKTYGKTTVVHGISIDIQDGEFIVIVGPSGCGKSTLLRMVAGLEDITAGEVHIGERLVNQCEPKDRNIAMVFQNYALYPHMSVRGNMAYGLKLRKLPKEEITRRVDKAATLLQIEGLLDRKPRQLSGGQRQRVAMGRAIVREPDVFLFDEPLSNLDAKLRVQMRLEIRRLQQRLQVTSLYVTHDQVEAMTMADRLVVINEGRAEQIGTPMEIYRNPDTLFVAGFIGSPAMNFLPVTVHGQQLRISDNTVLQLTAASTHQGPAILGIRPEHFTVPTNHWSELEIIIDIVEPLGAESLLHGHIEDLEIVIKLPAAIAARATDRFTVTVDPQHFYLFDPNSGQRIRQ